MGLQITIGASGQKELERTLAIKASQIKDLRPAWKTIERLMVAMQKKIFMAKGAGEGLPAWAKLKPGTVKEKQRNYPQWANFPLIRTQKLFKAWTKEGSPGAVRIREPLLFAFGIDESEIPYARHHQWGTSKMAKREHLRIPDGMRKSIVKVIQAHVVKTGQFERETIFNG